MPNEELIHILTEALYGNDGERSTAKCLFILYTDRRKTCRRRSQFHYIGSMDVKKGNISKGWMTKQGFHAS